MASDENERSKAMELFVLVAVLVIGLAFSAVGVDSRPSVGDDWHRMF